MDPFHVMVLYFWGSLFSLTFMLNRDNDAFFKFLSGFAWAIVTLFTWYQLGTFFTIQGIFGHSQ